MNPYKSCNCDSCRATSSKVRGFHKRTAHRALRRAARAALRSGREIPQTISSGYKA